MLREGRSLKNSGSKLDSGPTPVGCVTERGVREKVTLGQDLQASVFPTTGRKGIGEEGDSPGSEAEAGKAQVLGEAGR